MWLLVELWSVLVALSGRTDRRPRRAGPQPTQPPDELELGFVILGGACCLGLVALAGWLTAH